MFTTIIKAGKTVESQTIDTGGSQIVFGSAINMKVKKGRQFVSAGGIALQSILYCGYGETHKEITGGQILGDGGVAKKTLIKEKGVQQVSSGGKAYSTTVKNGGYQHVFEAGKAYATTLSAGGTQELHEVFSRNGALASGTIINGGKQVVRAGGRAIDTFVNDRGLQKIKNGGKATRSMVNSGGMVEVYQGGIIEFSTIDGNVLHFYDNGTLHHSGTECWVMLYNGAKALNTSAVSCGSLIISNGGVASNTFLGKGGVETIYYGGKAVATKVGFGGCQKVRGGVASDTVVLGGGEARVSAGGTVRMVTIAKGGKLVANAGARISSVKLMAGATMDIASGLQLAGTNNFTGATIIGGAESKRVSMATNAKLTIGTKTNMTNFHLNVAKANVTITGTGNTLGSLALDKSGAVIYDVSNQAAKSTAYMLTLSSKNTQKLGAFSVNVKKAQGIGSYELSKNIIQANGQAYSVTLGTTNLGTVKLNSTSLTKNGVTYSLKTSGAQVNLTVGMKAGAQPIFKGTNKTDTFSGTAHSEIFYGGKGNDTFSGKNGRDVAVYDTSAWGKDVIKKTCGTMTLLFNGLTTNDIVTKVSGSTMTITKKKDANQSITLQGWSNDTHNILFGSDMKNWNNYLKLAKPTSNQTTAARNEVWKKAGLASA